MLDRSSLRYYQLVYPIDQALQPELKLLPQWFVVLAKLVILNVSQFQRATGDNDNSIQQWTGTRTMS